MARLTTIPVSHYCEKARWILDATGSRIERSAVSAFTGTAIAPPPVAVVLPHTLSPGVELLAPNALSVKHWNRLLGGLRR